MNVHDEMSDSEVLLAASDSLSEIPMASPPDVEAIMARGRARRRHRLTGIAGLSAAGVVAGTALVLGLTGVLGSAPVGGTGTIRTAAFTLVEHANGTATLTINPKELLDPTTLRNDLAQYGIRAMVTVGSFCSSDPAPAGSRVWSAYPYLGPGNHHLPRGVHPTLTFTPAAMPAGTQLSFGVFQLSPGEQQTDFVLINTSSYTCTTTPPSEPPAHGGQLRVGPPGQAGS